MTQVALEPPHFPAPEVVSDHQGAPVAGRPWVPAALAATSGVIVISLLLVLLFGIQQREKGTVGEASVPLRQAADFELGLFDGGAFRLTNELGRGRPVLVNFWASWCVLCADEAAILENGWQRYRERLTFVGVDVQDTEADALGFLQKFHVTYPNGAGNAGPISIAYGMRGVPESYFIACDGTILRKWNGALTAAALDSYLAELLRAGQK